LPLETEHVRADQALDDLPAPRKLGKDLVTGERDVCKVTDAHVAAVLAQHPRNQLELVVVHPDGRAESCLLSRCPRETLVDLHVGLPPRTPEFRRYDDVVVKRP